MMFKVEGMITGIDNSYEYTESSTTIKVISLIEKYYSNTVWSGEGCILDNKRLSETTDFRKIGE